MSLLLKLLLRLSALTQQIERGRGARSFDRPPTLGNVSQS